MLLPDAARQKKILKRCRCRRQNLLSTYIYLPCKGTEIESEQPPRSLRIGPRGMKPTSTASSYDKLITLGVFPAFFDSIGVDHFATEARSQDYKEGRGSGS